MLRRLIFGTDVSKIKDLVQTSNLGVRGSNPFRRANHFNNLKHILFGDPGNRNGSRTPCGPRQRSNFKE